MKRMYRKACAACLKCRYKQPLDKQALCNNNCQQCALGTTMPVAGGSNGGLLGGGAPNAYGIDFDTGVGTVSCYDIAASSLGKCGSQLTYAGSVPGIDFDAAIPFAYWPPGVGLYGNCADCGIQCSGSYGPSSIVQYNGQPLCYNITAQTTGEVRTIRVNDGCGESVIRTGDREHHPFQQWPCVSRTLLPPPHPKPHDRRQLPLPVSPSIHAPSSLHLRLASIPLIHFHPIHNPASPGDTVISGASVPSWPSCGPIKPDGSGSVSYDCAVWTTYYFQSPPLIQTNLAYQNVNQFRCPAAQEWYVRLPNDAAACSVVTSRSYNTPRTRRDTGIFLFPI